MGAITIGPMMLATDRLAVVLGILAFFIFAAVLGRKISPRFNNWSWWVVFGGVAAARAGHVVIHWRNFGNEPWRTVALWDGGFYAPAALLAIVPLVLLALKTQRQRLWSLLPLGAGLIVWNITLQLTAGTAGVPLPEKSFLTVAGQSYPLNRPLPRPMVINLWATWCPPCRREMPMMANMAAASGKVDFVFANQGELEQTISTYLAREGLNIKTVLVDLPFDLSRHYEAAGLPVTLFVGADGLLRQAHMGEISREALEANIARLNSGS